MAKKPLTKSDKLVRKFLAGLARDPKKLAAFIRDPGGVMEEAGIPKKLRLRIRDELALKFSRRLARLMSYHEHF